MVEIPGEQLLAKLWETIAERGMGNLLKPWQMRRVETVRQELRLKELNELAKLEEEIVERRVKRFPQLNAGSLAFVTAEEIADGSMPLLRQVTKPDSVAATIIVERIAQDINVSKAILKAEAELEDAVGAAPTEDVNLDWLSRWRDCVSAVSDEELQSLWGKLLAGEVQNPGRFSLRTLEFLRNLSSKEAKEIEMLFSFAFNTNAIYRDDAVLEKNGISFKFLLHMQELGVVSGVDGLGLRWSASNTDPTGLAFRSMVLFNDCVLKVTHPDPGVSLDLKVCSLTGVAAELYQIGHFRSQAEHVAAAIRDIKVKGFAVEIAQSIKGTGLASHFGPFTAA
ncbi:MAG: hypothetical protein DI586_05275 [Micavibrio aeruginosavorus]|uniref:DUF2806 domain-containing protein n=1 Tax=Micavibrio aeruginosavorus TaxID=349221 RepID=A0A2W5FJ51_9BACT|nr:MAG: hypothetical protein DI586_05275 [Micavibrio aeruginosavorus]